MNSPWMFRAVFGHHCVPALYPAFVEDQVSGLAPCWLTALLPSPMLPLTASSKSLLFPAVMLVTAGLLLPAFPSLCGRYQLLLPSP